MKHQLALAALCGLLLAAPARGQQIDRNLAPPRSDERSVTVRPAGSSDATESTLATGRGEAYAWDAVAHPWQASPQWENPTLIWLKYPGGHLWATYCEEHQHQGHCRGCGAFRGHLRRPATGPGRNCEHCARRTEALRPQPGHRPAGMQPSTRTAVLPTTPVPYMAAVPQSPRTLPPTVQPTPQFPLETPPILVPAEPASNSPRSGNAPSGQ